MDVKEEYWYEKTDSNKATAPIMISIETFLFERILDVVFFLSMPKSTVF
jgi:hypothetical protein